MKYTDPFPTSSDGFYRGYAPTIGRSINQCEMARPKTGHIEVSE